MLRPTLALVLLLVGLSARPAAADDDAVVRARAEFAAGVSAAESSQWGEALASFERSAALRPHSLTTFNIGAAERALGRYTRARATLGRALAQNEQAGGKELAESFQNDARAWLADIDRLVARVPITIAPADATIAVDGRPLSRAEKSADTKNSDAMPEMVAGLLPAGVGERAPSATFTIVMDPGTHVLTVTKKGFAAGVVNKTFAPGAAPAIRLELERLPAMIHITADRPDAVVTINSKDVGIAPVDVPRPAGTYAIVVSKAGYEDYRTSVTLEPGGETTLKTTLLPEKIPVTKKWWFWASAVGVVGGGAALTYFLVRPDPQPPPYNGGSTGWVTEPRP